MVNKTVSKMVKKNLKKKNINKKTQHTKKNKKVHKSKKRNTQKKTKKITKRNKKRKSKQTKSTLINGGSNCNCGPSSSSNSFKNYMSDLRSSLSLDNLSGGGYSVLPDDSINGYKAVIKEYDDNNPPLLSNISK